MPLGKRFFNLIAYINFVVTTCISLFILFCRHQIVGFFTEDAQVIIIVTRVLMLVSFNFLFDGM